MVTGIIMAAGFSKRMGSEKLLLSVEGMPMVERVIRAAIGGGLEEIVFIYRRQELKALAEKYGLKTVYNGSAREGQSASLKLGIAAASPTAQGYLFLVGDQIFLTPSVIHQLLAAFYQNSQGIIVPVYKGKRGNPVLFPKGLRAELLQVEGDQGGRGLLEKYKERVVWLPIEEENADIDVDTPEQYQSIAGIRKK